MAVFYGNEDGDGAKNFAGQLGKKKIIP